MLKIFRGGVASSQPPLDQIQAKGHLNGHFVRAEPKSKGSSFEIKISRQRESSISLKFKNITRQFFSHVIDFLKDLKLLNFNKENVQQQKQQLDAVLPELGISSHEKEKIQNYVDAHLKEWKQSPPQKTLKKEQTGLPRSLHVFKDARGKVYVMVLCKTKRTEDETVAKSGKIVGEGAGKKVKYCVDWTTGKKYADIGIRGSVDEMMRESMQQQIKIGAKLAGKPGVSSPFMYVYEHEKQGSRQLRAFQEFLGEELDVKKEYSLSEKKEIIKQLSLGLKSLSKSGIEHQDIMSKNILIDGLQTKIIDFDIARIEDSKDSSNDKYRTLMSGTPFCIPPEKFLYQTIKRSIKAEMNQARGKGDQADLPIELATQLEENYFETIRPDRDKTWKKTDTWSMGLVFLNLTTGSDELGNKISKLVLDQANSWDKESITSMPANSKYEELQRDIDTLIDEKMQQLSQEERRLLELTKAMLQADPEKRISVSSLEQAVNKLFS